MNEIDAKLDRDCEMRIELADQKTAQFDEWFGHKSTKEALANQFAEENKEEFEEFARDIYDEHF